MVITFSNIKGSGGGGGATGGTVSGITLWSDETTMAYVDSAVTQAVETAVTSAVTEALTAYTKTEDFATINGSAITSGGNIVIEDTPYTAGTNIDITDHVISVTGITIPTSNTAFTNDAGYITSGDAQTQIDNAVSGKMDTSAMSAYTPTSGFSTINGSAITSGDNLVIEGTPYSGGTGISVDNHIISVTGDYETVIELTQAQYDALTAYSENTTYIITDAPSINMSAYTPTSGFSTINGSAITVGGNIEIEGAVYSAGTNINIDGNNVISVTGITVPTKTSDLQNDSGFITSNDIPTSNTAFTNDAGYITTADTQDFVTSGDVKTQIEGYNYVNSGDVQSQINDSISGKVDTSAMTAYWTSAETENAISSATEDFVTSADVETQITNKGYITGYTETDPVFQASAASGITANDIQNWNSKLDSSALTPYYTSEQTDTAISNATSGLASTTYVDNSVSGKVDTTAMTQYYTSAQTDTAISNATSGKQETLVSGTNIKTINNQSLLGSGNITIQGGSGSGETIVELTQAQYDALTAYSENTTYVITDATEIDLNDYMKVPSSGGSVYSILMNSGSQRPVWSTYKFQFISQTDYNNLQTKDSTTIYFIVS